MKVLVVGLITNEMNGSSKSFVRLCNLLSQKDNVTAIFPDNKGVFSKLNESCNYYIRNIIPVRRSIRNLLALPLSILYFLSILYRVKPDVVHINDIPWFYLIPFVKLMGIKVTIHSRYIEENTKVKKIISKFLIMADKIIFVSNFNKSQWKLPCKSRSITINNPGLFESDKIENTPDQKYVLPNRYCLVVARVSQDKGIKEAIDFFHRHRNELDGLKLVIAGDSQYPNQEVYKKECKEQVEQLCIQDDVVWLGSVINPRFLYDQASFFIHLPNFQDPFPTTIMEALSSGTGIVTNRNGGIPEQIRNFEGVVLVDKDLLCTDESLSVLKSESKYDRSNEYENRYGEEGFINKIRKAFLN